jgi:hypothetical protein
MVPTGRDGIARSYLVGSSASDSYIEATNAAHEVGRHGYGAHDRGPIAAVLVSRYDWRFAQLLIGLSVWVLLLPAAYLYRPEPAVQSAHVA